MPINSNDADIMVFLVTRLGKAYPGPLCLLLCIFISSFSLAGVSSASLAANLSGPEDIEPCNAEAYSLFVSSDEQADDLHVTVDLPEGFVYSGGSMAFLGELQSLCQPYLLGRSLQWDLSDSLRSCRHVVINELEQNPKGTDSGKEWIELYNPSSGEIKVGGWRIMDSYYRKTVILPQDASLPQNGILAVVWTNGSLINSRNLSMCLLDASGRTVDCTPGLVDEGDDDRSWGRVADGKDLNSDLDWTFQPSTRGYSNGGRVYDLYPGETFSLEFLLSAGCTAIAGKSIHAQVSSSKGSASAKSPPTNVKRANLSAYCTPDRSEAAKGDEATWRMQIKNDGNGTAGNVLVNISLSSGLEPLSIGSPGGSLNWSYGSLGPGEEEEVELRARATSSCDSYYTLLNITWGCGPCQMICHKSEIGRRTAIRKEPDGIRDLAVGDEADFQIEADLPPGGIRNIWINDSLPPGLIYDAGSFRCKGATPKKEVLDKGGSESPGLRMCWLFDAPISASDIELGYSAKAANSLESQNGLHLDVGMACMSWGDLNADCDEAGGLKLVEPDLALDAKASSSAGDVGDEMAFRLYVFHSESSTHTAFDVDIRDILPSGLCYSPGSAKVLSGPAATFEPDELRWHFDSLDPGWNAKRKVVLQYNATITEAMPGDVLKNNATLTWSSMPGDDPGERDGSGGVNDYLRTASSPVNVMRLSISNEAHPDPVRVGEPLTYALTYENQGAVAARNVTIIDELDKNLILLSSNPPGNVGNTTWTIPLLPPDGPHRIEVEALVRETAANGTKLINRFSIECDEISPVSGAVYTDVLNESRIDVNKTALQKSVRRGEEVTYTIKVCNRGGQRATNVSVRDVFDSRVELVYAYPPFEDGTDAWHLDSLEPGECVELELAVRIPREDVEFAEDQKINGSGFLRVSRDYTTSLQPYVLTNSVFVTSDQDKYCSDTEKITVIGEDGTDLQIREHGSGSYERVERLRYLSSNRSLEMDRLLNAHHQPTGFRLPGNRSENFTSRWSESVRARNGITGSSFQESYIRVFLLGSESHILLDENGSEIRLVSEFCGPAGFEISKKASKSAKGEEDVFESREVQAGSFRVRKSFQEHGKNVLSEDSLSGNGYVSVDKRVKNSQGSYETGAGAINLEETIQSSTGFLSKKIDVLRLASPSDPPAKDAALSSSMHTGSMEWREGMWSRGQGSFLEERFFSIESLKKTATFRGLRELESEADFSGKARLRVAYKDETNKSNEMDLTNEFVGEFYLKRRILLAGVSKYDGPHLSLFVDDKGDPANRSHLRYTITIRNDGNSALGPIYLRDLFPPGTEYIGSSVGPSDLAPDYANWTLLHLGIGGSSSIELELNATDEIEGIINRVEAAAGYDGQWITVGNFSVIESAWLPCSTSGIFISKEAALEPGTKDVVDYRISLHNPWNCTMAAIMVDILPAGMRMLGSSMLPSDLDSISNRVTWKIIDLLPGQTKTIEYRAQALQSGLLVNSARVEAFAVGGHSSAAVGASAKIAVNGEKRGDIGGWKLPSCVGLNYSVPCMGDDLAACYSCDDEPVAGKEILCAGCISSGQLS